MEELKILVDMISKLPTMALWVLIGFWAYKVIIVGSIYGVIRFVVDKLHNFLVTRKTEYKNVEIRAMLDGMCISGQLAPLIYQINRLRGKDVGIDTSYIHSASVNWLRDAIDDKIAKDSLKKQEK